MRRAVDRVYLARDVYATWKKRVQEAATEVIVFTPYLDGLTVRLLRNASPEEVARCVVTDLSPESGARDYRGQLLALRRLLTDGVEVRSLARLHAKVLLVDGRLATLGSQNFTSYARSSKETTSAPAQDLSESHLVDTLRAWHQQAMPVDPDLVDRLIDALAGQIADAIAAQSALVDAYEVEAEAHKAEVERRRRLADLEASRRSDISRLLALATARSQYRLAQRTAHARMTSLWSDSTASWYQSLIAGREDDLTAWLVLSDGSWRASHLQRLRFYPMILRPSGQMAYARVAKTRITYVWRSATWSTPQRWNGRHVYISVEFPPDVDSGNILITLKPSARSAFGCHLRLRYDGLAVSTVGLDPFGSAPEPLADMFLDFCDQSTADDWDTIQTRVFSSFNAHQVGIANHNASTFFSASDYQIDRVDLSDHPVLVATPL